MGSHMTNATVGAVNTAKPPSEANEGLLRHTILVLLGSYLPAYKGGGPIRSIANLVGALGEEFHFRIVTLDRDLGDKWPFPHIVVDRWIRIGNADVMYLRPGLLGLLNLYALLRSVEENTVLYLNSFFGRRFSMLAVVMLRLRLCHAKRLVLAPRGEFSRGALQFKHIRKCVYITISRWFRLYRDVLWHASSDFEASDILRMFPQSAKITVAAIVSRAEVRIDTWAYSRVAIAPDIATSRLPASTGLSPKVPGQLRAVFVSRISPKKNLAGALKMLAGVLNDIAFDIYGPSEDADYWEECQDLIAALPVNIHAQYCGQIEHAMISDVFASHDLLLFPTLGENYGHVICEALLAGCPVLISDETPWRNLEALGVGWDLPLSEPERFREVLQQCAVMGSEEYAAMRARAGAFGASRLSAPAVIEDNRMLFRLAVGPLGPA